MIIYGDLNLVIRQMRGEIDCKAPGLQLLRHKAMEKLQFWSKHEFLHVKRDSNASADRLASEALQKEKGWIVMGDQDGQDLVTLNGRVAVTPHDNSEGASSCDYPCCRTTKPFATNCSRGDRTTDTNRTDQTSAG